MLFSLRDTLRTLNLAAPPILSIISRDPARPVSSRLGILSGAFNPLTYAHLALAQRAQEAYGLDEVLFALSKVIVEKESVAQLSSGGWVGGACLEDRLLMLKLSDGRYGFGVILFSRGLYIEQAEALRQAFPSARLFFLVGFDKIVQILNPRYYTDRDAALHRLFELAAFVVAPRKDRGLQDLARLLSRRENSPYQTKVLYLPLPEDYRDLSSTLVREAVREGLSLASFVSEEVEAFVQETGLYAKPKSLKDGEEVEPYALRVLLLEALDRARSWAENEGDFHSLFRLALSDTVEGRRLRAFLFQLPEGPLEAVLQAFQVSMRSGSVRVDPMA